MHICQPFKSLSSSLKPWKISVFKAWLLSFFVSVLPLLNAGSSYFMHSISFLSKFHREGVIDVATFKQFMCNYAILGNKAIENSYENEIEEIEKFPKNNLPDSEPITKFGYFIFQGNQGVRRFYASRGDQSWEYVILIITINFLCFVFIAVSYLIIHKRPISSATLRNNRPDKQAPELRKRITQIIATDFCCWIPVCIMAFVRLEVNFSNIVYQISAVLLLPFHSFV